MRTLFLIVWAMFFLFLQVAHAAKNNFPFIENKGQMRYGKDHPADDILFYTDYNNVRIGIRKDGISYFILKYEEEEHEEEHKEFPVMEAEIPELEEVQRIDLRFIGVNSTATVTSINASSHYFNYYGEVYQNGFMQLHAFEKVMIKDLYENVDMIFYMLNGELKYDLVINDLSHINDIAFKIDGVEKIEWKDNKLSTSTINGTIVDEIKNSYIEYNGHQTMVDISFQMNYDTIRFQGDIPDLPYGAKLVIDPAVFITYLGGTNGGGNGEKPFNMTTDSIGNVYVIGQSDAIDFPYGSGIASPITFSFMSFVSKIDPDGNLLWSSFLSTNTLTELARDICIGNNNEIYMGGSTTEPALPLAINAYNNDWDGYIVKFNSSGNIVWSRYIGGVSGDELYTISFSPNTSTIVFGGVTYSVNFPLLNAIQINTDGTDGFIGECAENGTLLFSSFFGGTGGGFADYVTTSTCSTSGSFLFGGYTESNVFPIVGNSFNNTFQGGSDGFFAEVSLLDHTLVYSSYIGGTGFDYLMDMALGINDHLTLTGLTSSSDFPITPPCYQSIYGGGISDIFISSFDHSTMDILWSTYYGNIYWEYISFVEVDEWGNIYIMSEWEDDNFVNLPVYSCAFQKNFNGTEDQFIAKFNSEGDEICFTYLGGPLEDDLDFVYDALSYRNGYLYYTCYSYGSYPITPNAFQPNINGATDIVVGKLCSVGCGEVKLDSIEISFDNDICNAELVTLRANAVACDTGSVNYIWYLPGANPSTIMGNNVQVSYNQPGVYNIQVIADTKCWSDTLLKNKAINVQPCNLFIPNVFTPNEDNMNDLWNPVYAGEAKISIYNRWGVLLYDQYGSKLAWNGKTYSGDECPESVYFYVIEYSGVRQTGFIHLFR